LCFSIDVFGTDFTTFAIDQTGYKWEGDVGAFISFTIPLGIVSANVANNRLDGQFASGWFSAAWPNLEKLSIANNIITGPLPADLWSIPSKKLSSLDFSGNMWTGSLPAGKKKKNAMLTILLHPLVLMTTVNVEFLSGTPQRTITNLNFQNCPSLISATNNVPQFAKASSSLIKDASGLFSCPSLISSDITLPLQVSLDPSYYGYF
jgi:hypothetical protein